jgi:hypothetical protein
MSWTEYAPAALLLSGVTCALLWRDVMPSGSVPVLVRLRSAAPEAGFAAAALADAAVIAIPAPGFVVLRGDAARIRRELGLAAVWRGADICGFGVP